MSCSTALSKIIVIVVTFLAPTPPANEPSKRDLTLEMELETVDGYLSTKDLCPLYSTISEEKVIANLPKNTPLFAPSPSISKGDRLTVEVHCKEFTGSGLVPVKNTRRSSLIAAKILLHNESPGNLVTVLAREGIPFFARQRLRRGKQAIALWYHYSAVVAKRATSVDPEGFRKTITKSLVAWVSRDGENFQSIPIVTKKTGHTTVKPVSCPACRGLGHGGACPECKGKGKVGRWVGGGDEGIGAGRFGKLTGGTYQEVRCSSCGGTGKMTCRRCEGKGEVEKQVPLLKTDFDYTQKTSAELSKELKNYLRAQSSKP